MPALARGVTVRILRPPPSRMLEGVDLGPRRFEAGHVYELAPDVANVLVVWEYAQRVESPQKRARKRR